MKSNDNQPRPTTRYAEILDMRLGWLRRALRASLALRGLCLVVILVVSTAVVSFMVDRVFRLSVPGRALALLLYVALVGWFAWRHLLTPVRRALTDGVLADLIEEKFPRLHDVLRSGVEFAGKARLKSRSPESDEPPDPDAAEHDDDDADDDTDDDTTIRSLMERRVVETAARAAEETEIERIVDTRRLARMSGACLFLLVASVVLAVFSGSSFRLWFQRNLLLSSEEWPYRTELVVEGFSGAHPALGVPRGDPITLRVRANEEKEIPDRVRILLDYESESRRFNLAREGESLFVYEHPEVIEPFDFYVEGGDFRSQQYRVFVLERPEIADFQVRLVFPAYTGKPPATLEGDVGELAVPEGTRLTVEAVASKPLERAWLETLEEVSRVPLEFTSGDTAITGSYVPAQGGLVTVHLEDKEGVPPDRWLRFLVQIVPDRLPTVTVRTRGIGTMITPIATIPLEVKANDDYGVTALGVDYEVRGDTGEPEPGTTPFDAIEPEKRVEAEPVWDLETLEIAPDRRLDMRVYAVDNNAIQGPQKNHAATQSFLVVTAEKLLEEFLRREEEQRRVLERALEEQRQIRDSVYRLVDETWKEEGPLGDEAVRELVSLARSERQLGRQMAAISQAMRQILDEMRNNRIAELNETERLAGTIITPLAELSERLFPGAVARMTVLREMQKEDERVQEGLELAGDVETIITVMEQVLLSMKRIEGFTEVINRLRSVMKVHAESTEETLKSYRRAIEQIFQEVPPEDDETDETEEPR